jgi:palmitoyl transferase
MQLIQKFLSAAFAATVVLFAFPAAAHAEEESLWQQTKDRVNAIADQGSNELYVSGYAYHGRGTYTREKLDQLNEEAWGGGFGRTLRNASGNDESLYFMGISDSHKQPQFMGGYAYEWVWPIARTGVETGLGYTAMLMSRQDYLSGVPFPIVLPVASIGVKGAKLMASYVPRLSKNRGNGDVLFMFLRFELPKF